MTTSDSNPRNVLWPVAGLLLLAALARVIPHTANVTPFFAVAMAAGAWMGRDQVKLTSAMAIGSMLISDLVLGFHWTMPFVYAGLAIGILVGAIGNTKLVKTESAAVRLLKAIGFAGTGSAGFFVVSNIGVWLVGGIYPMTADGLISCFVMAVPFFMKSLASDLFFGSLLLMGVAQLSARRSVPVRDGVLNAR
ncbi:MAG: DUF6580 family putative transport protein [Bdellovibrionales bacterium]|nr:DUF6580 family putative transport protein [Bdellovibrionales bacterium]